MYAVLIAAAPQTKPNPSFPQLAGHAGTASITQVASRSRGDTRLTYQATTRTQHQSALKQRQE
ncbi:hypothetical protein E2C01_065389 [Portunus trituberculatus]|uniref:Uncharacterized protein n=1 Tax=Portunus trituberculatus TaxID=210409 RepID=A0A5B7HFH2_PORTR|nr:hypothetical protein [Portunus trituberculatus]